MSCVKCGYSGLAVRKYVMVCLQCGYEEPIDSTTKPATNKTYADGISEGLYQLRQIYSSAFRDHPEMLPIIQESITKLQIKLTKG